MQDHQRQLAAILFTDIVGYTALMQQDETKAVALIKLHRSAVENSVPGHGGKVIEYFGDGTLCVFPSATAALKSAMEIQLALQKEPMVPLRIGLHIGEVLFEEGRVMGDGVNLASRIQSLGKAGSILFSKEIFDKVRNHAEFKTSALGFFALKNVNDPMEVFALTNEGLTVPRKEEMVGRLKKLNPRSNFSSRFKWILISIIIFLAIMTLWLSGLLVKRHAGFTGKEKSIAVLPFENIGNDTLQQYFSDGITEDIITQLSKIAGLKVISRTSVMQYKNTTKTIKQIADELNVAAILEGSVRKEGDSVRINAQLIDANSDRHIWAEQYDRNASEVFAIQTEVAQRIANQLNVKLTPDEGKRIKAKATGSIEAYEVYLKARTGSFLEREKLLKEALKKDSTFALAWAGLALTYSKMPLIDPTDQPYYIRKSLDAALTGVNYGPELSETHMVLGDILKTITLNPRLSIKELKKSIALNPNNAEAYIFLAFALMELGEFQESEINLIKGQQLDPLSRIMMGAWATYYWYSRNAPKLLEFIRAEPLSSNRFLENGTKLSYHFLRDEYDSMIVYARQVNDPVMLGIAYAKTGHLMEAKKIADSLQALSAVNHSFELGILYAWMDEKQKAMDFLNLSYRLYDYGLIRIKVDKRFDPLRNESSFKNLLTKMGME